MNPQLLSELHDIHAPPPPSHWPPGPLLWLAIALGVLALLAVLGLILRWRANAWRRDALAELQRLEMSEHSDERERYTQCNLLLKRMCRQRYGSRSAALIDADWLRLLSWLYDDEAFIGEFGALCVVPYSGQMPEDAPGAEQLLGACRRIIRRAPSRLPSLLGVASRPRHALPPPAARRSIVARHHQQHARRSRGRRCAARAAAAQFRRVVRWELLRPSRGP